MELESPDSKISPGSKAAVAFTKPLPMSNGVAGDVVESGLLYARCAMIIAPCLSKRVAVVERAEAMAEGLKFGNFCLIRAASPATCGAAILVPDIIANFSPNW